MKVYLVKCAVCAGNAAGVMRVDETQFDPATHEVVGIEGEPFMKSPGAPTPAAPPEPEMEARISASSPKTGKKSK